LVTDDGSRTAEDGARRARERTERAILDATREILAEKGVHHLTVEGVAARSGVAKTTIYRRWRSKDELALAVLLRMIEDIDEVPDLGDARAELIGFVGGAVEILGTTLMGQVMRGLISDLATDPRLGAAYRDRIVGSRFSELGRLLDRAVARGELRQGLDVEFVHGLLIGPVYYRLLISGAPLSAGLAERIVDSILPALRPAAA
jgi:AcrR family transcriptional regulator